MAKKSPTNKPKPEDLGKMLVNIYESGYLNHNQAYKMSFIKGIFSGLGGAIGATLVLGLLLWVLSLFQDIPLLGRLIENFQDNIKK